MPAQFNALCQIPRLHLAWDLVKAKGSAGGIDGMTIIEFEKEKRKEIPKLAEELKAGIWKPQPYMEIEMAKTKNPDEIRKLGMTAIRDKIVQHAIKSIIEPRYERIFLGNSYGYRPGKGATKAIRRVLAECSKKQYKYVLRLDIDNYFDTIDHEILQKRLIATGTEAEIVRLIMLCVKMGKVKQNSLEWMETEYGNPFESLIHVQREGKPTLVYDMIEIFRSQVVDRVVISLVQKGQDLEVRNGLLTDHTRQLLVKSVMERLARYEKYQGEEIKMEQIILRQTKLLAKAFEGTDKFKPYVAKW